LSGFCSFRLPSLRFLQGNGVGLFSSPVRGLTSSRQHGENTLHILGPEIRGFYGLLPSPVLEGRGMVQPRCPFSPIWETYFGGLLRYTIGLDPSASFFPGHSLGPSTPPRTQFGVSSSPVTLVPWSHGPLYPAPSIRGDPPQR